jgi:hypothetical protein
VGGEKECDWGSFRYKKEEDGLYTFFFSSTSSSTPALPTPPVVASSSSSSSSGAGGMVPCPWGSVSYKEMKDGTYLGCEISGGLNPGYAIIRKNSPTKALINQIDLTTKHDFQVVLTSKWYVVIVVDATNTHVFEIKEVKASQ